MNLEFQPLRTADHQDATWKRHGENHYMRMIEAYAFAAKLERELAALSEKQPSEATR